MFIKKEELLEDYSINNDGVKEEVASICDEHEFDSEVVPSQEDEKLSLGLVKDENFPLGHPSKDGNDLQIKIKREKANKLNKNEQETNHKETGFTIKTGRISRDNIFKNKDYFCYLCQKCFLGRKCFKKHFNNHFTACQNRFTCLICTYISRTVSHINRHILETHFHQEYEAEKLFACTLCEKRFHERRDLERHVFTHSGQGAWKCAECEYSCAQKHRLKTHFSTAHGYPETQTLKRKSEKESRFICHHCNYSSKEKSALAAHIKRHIGYKTYKCSECSYMCTGGGDLRKHSTIHSNDRPFVCTGCKKTFKRRSHLLIHFNGKYDCRGVRKQNKSKT